MKKEILFTAVDISTERKGPMYTFIEGYPPEIPTDSEIIITFSLVYGYDDLPFNEDACITSTYICDTLGKYYSIYPMIHQMFQFNRFIKKNYEESGEDIHIQEINCQYGKQYMTLTEEATYKEIKKTFKHIHMNTKANKIYQKYGYVYLIKGGYWDAIPNDGMIGSLPKNYKLFYMIWGSGTSYLLSVKFLQKIRSCKSVQISVPHIWRDTYLNEYESEKRVFILIYLSDILEGCLFIPQLILLDQHLYNSDLKMEILIECNDQVFCKEVTSEEVKLPQNTCVIRLLHQMLKGE